MSSASNISKENASRIDHTCMTEQQKPVGGQWPFTLKSWKRPENTKQKILRRRPQWRAELVQADKPTKARAVVERPPYEPEGPR